MNQPDVIRVPILTRVEGEGGVTIRLRDGKIENVHLNIFEPPRLFEALLRGRPLEDTPDITARICGICPVAYQMSSIHALESALEIQITPEIRTLRRLMYCGEWIESHALHVHFLHAPDFFGAASGMALAPRFPNEIKRGLELKKFGNRLLETIGGRAIHPVNAMVGGFYRLPKRDELTSLIRHFEWGVNAAVETTRWVASFPFPDFDGSYEFVSLSHPDEYPMNEGDIVSSSGLHIHVSEFHRHFIEEQVAHSTALHAERRPQRSPYFLGPLARVNLNRDRLSVTATTLADELRFPFDCRNPFMSIIARGLELVHAFEEALAILRSYDPSGINSVAYKSKVGSGCAATEAPRGLLFHEYHVDSSGKLVSGRIVPPTSQNQKQIEQDLTVYLTMRLQSGASRDELSLDCERLVRTYDPCISCSTHCLKVRWENAS
ncbi:Ni/Fe hydrogenase subunit alpha [Schlesneria paludicola]|uniref:Ni/Fe hydrogenase subunit alpha n=1 Tax=Schlesneria paludicola TaxID=360056 RepID=UPI00029B473C|nr:nickel-dependent hydrogenase large subunit [Schlesneria paludicola]